MRVAIISDWFAEKMGYAENFLPKAMAALGADTHVITTDAQVYFDTPFYKATYEPFIGPPLVDCGEKKFDGYTLHRLPHGRSNRRPWKGRLCIPELRETLRNLRPDVVQTFDVSCPSTHDAAAAQRELRYKLFLETHTHASVFSGHGAETSRRTIWHKMRSLTWLTGRLDSLAAEKCYPISTDSADIAAEYFGVPRKKIQICPLGVDDDLFKPPQSPEELSARNEFRRQLGFKDDELVCVYTGRLTADKGPLLLAKAVEQLQRGGGKFRGLFVGAGPREVADLITGCAGCMVRPFVPARELPPWYWVADIGVWPKQESTSQLDAMACALPIIVSHKVDVKERVDGNGLYYQEDSAEDLARQILSLSDPGTRHTLGATGRKKIVEQFSWRLIAKERLDDYARSLGKREWQPGAA